MFRKYGVVLLMFLLVNELLAANLLKDGGFERKGKRGCGEGWVLSGWGKRDAVATLDETDPASGKSCLKVDVKYRKTGSVFMVGKLEPITAGKYRVSFKMKAKGDVANPILACVRSIGHPYRRYIQSEFVPTEQWAEYSFNGVTLDSKGEDVGFFFSLRPDSPATVWLDDVILEKVKEKVVAAKPDFTYGNILRNGEFEVYTGRDWVVRKGNHTIIQTPSAASGQKALRFRLTGDWKKAQLASTCFSVPAKRKYYLGMSSMVKGQANVKMSLYSARSDEFVMSLAATPQRGVNEMMAFDGEVMLDRGAYYCILEATTDKEAEVFIDGVSVVDGKGYKPSGIDAGIYTDKTANIFAPDEPVKLELDLFNHGNAVNQKLSLSVANLTGKEVYSEEIELPLKNNALTRQQVTFKLNETGAFLAKLRDGQKLLTSVNFSVLPKPKPVAAAESVFGGHMNAKDFELNVAKRMGLHWTRTHDCSSATWWRYVEPKKGLWSFQDAKIKKYRDGGFMILGMMCHIPDWANGGKGKAAPPKDDKDYATFAKTTVQHYKDSIKHWEVMNEPYLHTMWSGTPEQYAVLAQKAVKAIKEADPNAFVLTTCTAPTCVDFTEPALKAGALKGADAMSYHAYGEYSWKNYPNIVKWSGNLPTWNTETGMATKSFYNDLPEVLNKYTLSNRGVACAEAAGNQVKLVTLSLGLGAKRYFFYWNVYEHGLGTRLASMCAFEHDRTLRAHAVAYAIAVNLLDPCTGHGVFSRGNTTFVLLQKEKETICVLWNDKAPVDIELAELPAGSRVLNVMGNRLDLKDATLKLGAAPVYVVMPKTDDAIVDRVFGNRENLKLVVKPKRNDAKLSLK